MAYFKMLSHQCGILSADEGYSNICIHEKEARKCRLATGWTEAGARKPVDIAEWPRAFLEQSRPRVRFLEDWNFSKKCTSGGNAKHTQAPACREHRHRAPVRPV